ncbi:hypothetical protein HY837_06000 [archaeon]|nr:hypothetical protein [archaeon]
MTLKRFEDNLKDIINREIEAMTSETDDPKDWLSNLHWITSEYMSKFKNNDFLVEYMQIMSDYLIEKENRPSENFYCDKKLIEKFKEVRNPSHQFIAYTLIFSDLVDNPPNTENCSSIIKEGVDRVINISKQSDVYQYSSLLDVPSIKEADDVFLELHEDSGLI